MAEGDAGELVRPSRRAGRYANVFRVGFNAFEVVIEFGEQFSGVGFEGASSTVGAAAHRNGEHWRWKLGRYKF